MSSTTKGFSVKQVDVYRGEPTFSQLAVNLGKVLPATTTGGIFQVTGSIICSLVGVVSTVLSATAVKPSIGVTGNNTLITAQPAVAYSGTAVGSVIKLPARLGAALPAAVTASGVAAAMNDLVVSNTNITVTTDATNTGAVTWLLLWSPANRFRAAAVTNL